MNDISLIAAVTALLAAVLTVALIRRKDFVSAPDAPLAPEPLPAAA